MDEAATALRRALESSCLAQAEILRMDGSVRASTGRFLTTVREGRRLVKLFEAPADALSEGITVGGLTYVAAQANRNLLHGKQADCGVIAVKRPPFVVVGLYEAGRAPADAVVAVDQLATLLASGAP